MKEWDNFLSPKLFKRFPALSNGDLQYLTCLHSQHLGETRMTFLYISRWVWFAYSPLRSLWQNAQALTAGSSAPCWPERLGGAAITTFRDVGRRCRYPLAQTITSLRLILIVSGNKLDSSCAGDGAYCYDEGSPCPKLLGAGVPAVLNHSTILHAFSLAFKAETIC